MTTDQRPAPAPRHYRCSNRSCSHEERGDAIPKGWVGIMEYPGDFEIRPSRLGLFCGIECAAEALETMRDEVPA